jgi:hypothetical protein
LSEGEVKEKKRKVAEGRKAVFVFTKVLLFLVSLLLKILTGIVGAK